MRRKRRSSSKNNLIKIRISGLIIAASIASGYISYYYSEIRDWNNFIYPGVMVEGINLSGYSKEEAVSAVKQRYSEQIQKKKISITAADKKYVLNFSKLNPQYDFEGAVKVAYSYGKNLNIFSRYERIKNPKNVNYNLKITYDNKPVKELISKVESEINQQEVDATLSIDKGNFNVVPEKNGRKLEKDKLEKNVLSKIDGNLGEDISLKAEVQSVQPRIKKEMLTTINARIGSFSTDFGLISTSERANNIILATKSINGKILTPGDMFSFNDTVGERTAKRGYKAAPVIIGDKLESGLGGGICQVSSTLYNALYIAGIPPTERTHHTLPVHYVSEGMDATVDYGNIDFKFKNTLNYPIYIEAYTQGGKVIFNLYSNKIARN